MPIIRHIKAGAAAPAGHIPQYTFHSGPSTANDQRASSVIQGSFVIGTGSGARVISSSAMAITSFPASHPHRHIAVSCKTAWFPPTAPRCTPGNAPAVPIRVHMDTAAFCSDFASALLLSKTKTADMFSGPHQSSVDWVFLPFSFHATNVTWEKPNERTSDGHLPDSYRTT